MDERSSQHARYFLYFGGDHKGVKALILAPAFGAVWPFILWITARETYRTRKEAEQGERERAAWEKLNRRLQEKGLLTDDGRYVKVYMFFGDYASDIGDYVSVLREWNIEQKHNQTARTESWRYRVLRVEREFTTCDEHAKYRIDVGDRLVAIYAPPERSLVYHGSLDTRRSYEGGSVK